MHILVDNNATHRVSRKQLNDEGESSDRQSILRGGSKLSSYLSIINHAAVTPLDRLQALCSRTVRVVVIRSDTHISLE